MYSKVTSLNLLQLWNLLSLGGAQWLSLIKPAIKSSDRQKLMGLGLIEEAKEKPSPEALKLIKAGQGGKTGKASRPAKSGLPKEGSIRALIKLRLSPSGLDFLGERLTEPVNRKSTIAPVVLEFLLGRLALKGPGREVLDFLLSDSPLVPKPAEKPSPGGLSEDLDPREVLGRVRSLDRSLFMAAGGLRLSVLRKALPEFGRASLDRALEVLQNEGLLVLYRFDDSSKVTAEDEEAAIITAGVPRHYFYLK